MKGIKIGMLALLLLAFGSLQAKDYQCSLFGIKSDGITMNTRSIQRALDYIHEQGGGRLMFSVGRYLTGSIHLKSNVTIHLSEGAVVVGSTNPYDYDKDGDTALILARDQEHIGITGKGVIDGRGREVANNLVAQIEKGIEKDPLKMDRPNETIRPMIFYFRSCRDVTVEGVLLKNSASWVQTYDQCKGLKIENEMVDSKAYWNNDGMDIVDCDGVQIRHCLVDASDDGICLKSHDPNSICQNVEIRDCVVRSSANGIKFGTYSKGGYRNVRIISNKVYDTFRSAITFTTVDGGVLEHIELDSLEAVNTGNGIFLRTGTRSGALAGNFNDVKISNVKIEIPAGKPDAGYEYEGPVEDMPRNVSPGIIITGIKESPIHNVVLNNITIEHPGGGNSSYANIPMKELEQIPEMEKSYPEFSMFRELPAWGTYIRHADGITFNNVNLICGKKDFRMAVVLDDVHGATFKLLKVKESGKKQSVYSNKSTNIVIH